MGHPTDDLNPLEFRDGEGRLNPRSLAKALVDERRDEPQGEPRYVVATGEETDTVYWHNGRVWTDRGETVLEDACWKFLGDTASTESVNRVIRHVRQLTRKPRESILDLPPEKLVVRNGVVDLTTGEFSERFSRPGTLTYLDVEHDPGAHPESFNEFLFDILPDKDVPIMWELIGYTLFRGYPFQKAFILLGDGANGKSTLLSALRDFLGRKNVSAVELQELDGNRFKKAKLEGKLANIAPDLDDDELESTGTFKALTGGDLLDAERKYEEPFEFENHATLIFSANQKPAAGDGTYAYARRWVHFTFPNTFTGEDAVPQEQLLAEFREEHPGILNLAVESFRRLWARGGFETTTWDAEHGDDADDVAARPILRFVKDELVESPGSHVRVKEAYNAYRAWAKEHGHTPQARESHFEPAVVEEYTPAAGNDPDNQNYKVWLDLALSGDAEHGEEADGEAARDGTVTDYA